MPEGAPLVANIATIANGTITHRARHETFLSHRLTVFIGFLLYLWPPPWKPPPWNPPPWKPPTLACPRKLLVLAFPPCPNPLKAPECVPCGMCGVLGA